MLTIRKTARLVAPIGLLGLLAACAEPSPASQPLVSGEVELRDDSDTLLATVDAENRLAVDVLPGVHFYLAIDERRRVADTSCLTQGLDPDLEWALLEPWPL